MKYEKRVKRRVRAIRARKCKRKAALSDAFDGVSNNALVILFDRS
jgi:hypothetical protein